MIETYRYPNVTSIHTDYGMVTLVKFSTNLTGWTHDEERGRAFLDVEQLPALPFLCQSTIDAMDQDAEYHAYALDHGYTIDFGRYS